MKKIILSLLLFGFLAPLSCAKEKYQIGREDPEKEIQKCIKLSKKKLYEEAIECLEIFKSRFPNTSQGQEASLRIADTYFNQKQFLLAADAYLEFVKLNPFHSKTEYAYYRAGLSYLKESPKAIDRDQQYLLKAKETMQMALRFSADGTYEELIQESLKNIDERLASRLMYVARFYYRTEEYMSAIPRLEELLEKYPRSTPAPKALYYLSKSHGHLGNEDKAREAVQNLITYFPKDEWTKKARKQYDGTMVR